MIDYFYFFTDIRGKEGIVVTTEVKKDFLLNYPQPIIRGRLREIRFKSLGSGLHRATLKP